MNFFEILILYFQNSKIQKYSPSESAKVYDKAINRKTGVHFHPKQTLDFLRSDMANSKLTEDVKRSIVRQYLDVSTELRSIPGWLLG
jgi:cohesin loading factor subunit SCC2